MAKCPWESHNVPGFNADDFEPGDAGTCGKCQGRYTVVSVKPVKLKKRGKKPK
jgi:hypothetical protein